MKVGVFYKGQYSEAFSKAVSIVERFSLNWDVDKIEFCLWDKYGIEFGKKTVRIFIDQNNFFIKTNDERGVKAVLIQYLYRAYRKFMGKSFDDKLTENVAANREAIRHGFGDLIFYANYMWLINHKHYIADKAVFFKIQTGWLSFLELDNYNAEVLKRIVNEFKLPLYKRKEWPEEFENFRDHIGDLIANNKI